MFALARGCVAIAVVIAMGSASTALAQTGEGEKTARGILKSANEHYQASRFDKAARMYITAHEVSGNPAYIYNAGRAEQRAFRLDAAEKHFREYLRLEKKDERGIARARQRLQEIEESRAALARANAKGKAAAKVESTPPPAASSNAASADLRGDAGASTGWSRATTGTALLLVGLGVGGAGGWLLWDALGEQSDFDGRIEESAGKDGLYGLGYDAYSTEQEKINNSVIVGDVVLGTGAVVAAVGAWLLLTDSPTTSVAFDVGPQRFSMSAAVRF